MSSLFRPPVGQNAEFVLRISFWNQYNICICNVFPKSSEKFTFVGGSLVSLRQLFWILRAYLTSGQDFSHSPITATSACLWLMSFTWHFQRLIRSQTEGSCGRPPLPLIYIWMRAYRLWHCRLGTGRGAVGDLYLCGTARQTDSLCIFLVIWHFPEHRLRVQFANPL